MIMDCEIFDIVCKMMEGMPVDEENLTHDTTREVGPGATFLTQKHTKEHMRELWLSTLMDRRPYSKRKEKKDEARDRARHRAEKILDTHKPEPLESGLIEELNKIIKSVEKKSGSKRQEERIDNET